ncbi:FLOT1 protein, partial [Peucedramus taeniatus]|nr:FLOT1 protein [Peucedramus taeniatus]
QEIYKDRQKFSDQVFRVASSDLVNMGISVVSYTLKDVHDEQVTHLGMAGDTWGHTWGQLGAAGTHLGHAWPHVPLFPVPVSLPLWVCDLSPVPVYLPGWIGDLSPVSPCPPQAARSQQAIAAQRGEVALVERAQRVQLQEQEVGRRRQELEATVRKPAEAERYRLERLAEAHR